MAPTSDQNRAVPVHNRYLEAREGCAASPSGARRSPNGSYLKRSIAANPLICKLNVVVSGGTSDGSDLLFQTMEWKRISVWTGYGTAFFFIGVWPPGSEVRPALSRDDASAT